jgi:tetratricopeptide (TPR) repeat protein
MMKQHALLTLALLAVACGSTPEGPDPDTQLAMHREFALRYYDEGDLDRAEQQIDKALDIAPKDDQLLLMKGWVRQRRGTADDIFVAEAIFRDLVDDEDYRALLGLAEALERKGVLYWESAAAVASGERFTEAADPMARADELRVEAQKSWNESVQYYELTLEQKPGEIQAINGLQRVHALAGDLTASLDWSRRLLDSTDAEIRFWTTQLERPDLTADEELRLRDLLASSSDLQVQTHLHASSVLFQLGRTDEALVHVDAAVALAPESPAVHSRRAQLLHGLGRTSEAVEEMQSFLRLSDLDFDHPDVVLALELLTRWQREAELDPEPSEEVSGG